MVMKNTSKFDNLCYAHFLFITIFCDLYSLEFIFIFVCDILSREKVIKLDDYMVENAKLMILV